jgi:hypothetical protein
LIGRPYWTASEVLRKRPIDWTVIAEPGDHGTKEILTVGKKPVPQVDHIAEALKPKQKKELYKMTIKIDKELYEEALPKLEGKFAALMEGAIREALERLKSGKVG